VTAAPASVVFVAGAISSAGLTVTVATTVLPVPSLSWTVSVPARLPAIHVQEELPPVQLAPSTPPDPLVTTVQLYPEPEPPEAVNVTSFPASVVLDAGEMTSNGLIVTVAIADNPLLSIS
jgi:hypothetical protein